VTAISDLRAAVARADEVLGCAFTQCRYKPQRDGSPGRCQCGAIDVSANALGAVYRAAKALVAAEEPRERWVDADGVTRLPTAMREELGVGDGAHIWFLRGPERWEAWQESEVSDLFGGEPISESAIRTVNAAMAQERDGDPTMFAEAFDEVGVHVRATSHDNACSGSNEVGQ